MDINIKNQLSIQILNAVQYLDKLRHFTFGLINISEEQYEKIGVFFADENSFLINEFLKALKPSDKVFVARSIEFVHKSAARERRVDGHIIAKQNREKGIERVLRDTEYYRAHDKGRCAFVAAKRVGWSKDTYYKAQKVVDAAIANPSASIQYMNAMDISCKVETAYKALKDASQSQETSFPSMLF